MTDGQTIIRDTDTSDHACIQLVLSIRHQTRKIRQMYQITSVITPINYLRPVISAKYGKHIERTTKGRRGESEMQ